MGHLFLSCSESLPSAKKAYAGVMPRIINLANLEQFTAINLLVDPGHIAGPVQIPSCAQITINWQLADGRAAHNVLYGRYSGAFAGNQAQANSIMTALTTGGAWTALAAFFATTTTVSGVSIRDVNTPNAPLINSNNAAVPGTSASPELPDEVAAVITLRTAFTGPGFRGRVYVPGWATNSLATGNVIAAAAVTALNSWGGTISGALAAGTYTWVLGQPARAQYTGSTGRVHPARSAMSTTISQTVVRDNHWDSQRRRGLK